MYQSSCAHNVLRAAPRTACSAISWAARATASNFNNSLVVNWKCSLTKTCTSDPSDILPNSLTNHAPRVLKTALSKPFAGSMPAQASQSTPSIGTPVNCGLLFSPGLVMNRTSRSLIGPATWSSTKTVRRGTRLLSDNVRISRSVLQ